MRRIAIISVLGFLAAFSFGCKKAAPTSFMKDLSVYYTVPGSSGSSHYFYILSVSPYHVPTVTLNGYTVPSENISGNMGDFSGSDEQPSISPGNDLELKVTYYDLNEKEQTASAKQKVPPEPAGMNLSVNSSTVTISWSAPNDVNFINALISISCIDNSYNTADTVWDTTIVDVKNITSVSKSVSSLCAGIGDPVYISVTGGIMNMNGPWSGAKDNIKGIKGQFYTGAYKVDTATWIGTTFKGKPVSHRFDVQKDLKRIFEKLPTYADEGVWITR
ncbi:MAG: hypothetical protein GXO39_04065 [Thermotogae bacterium]|nr:hypothetical protein [Thermotogota bacterium]